MFKAIKQAHDAGWRAGMVKPLFLRPGGTRGVIRLCEPINPYNNPFAARFRLVLAMAWELGRHDGRIDRHKLLNNGYWKGIGR
jgi:hypothetical protein